MNIPNNIVEELKEKQKDYPNAWIGFNAHTDEYSVYLIPYNLCNSLFIVKLTNS